MFPSSRTSPRCKQNISLWLYEEYRRLWIATGHEPHKRNNWKIVAAVMEHIEAAGIWIPEQEVAKYFYRRKAHYRNRIEKELQTTEETNKQAYKCAVLE